MQGSDYYSPEWLEFTLGEEMRENIKERKNSEKAVASVTRFWVCRWRVPALITRDLFKVRDQKSQWNGSNSHIKDDKNHMASWNQNLNWEYSQPSFLSVTLWLSWSLGLAGPYPQGLWLLGDPKQVGGGCPGICKCPFLDQKRIRLPWSFRSHSSQSSESTASLT